MKSKPNPITYFIHQKLKKLSTINQLNQYPHYQPTTHSNLFRPLLPNPFANKKIAPSYAPHASPRPAWSKLINRIEMREKLLLPP